MSMTLVHRAVGTAHLIPARLRALMAPRDERGLSQSTEQALLVAGAIVVALGIGAGVLAFVTARLAAQGVTFGE